MKMNTSWKTYLLCFAQEHTEFRLAELNALLTLFKIKMEFVEEPKDSPFWLARFPREEDVKLITNRSILLKSSLELWGHANTTDKLHAHLKQLPTSLTHPYLNAHKSFKIEVETFCKHFTQKEKIDKIETFNYLPVEGTVNLNSPDTCLEYIEYYGTVANNPPDLPYDVYFGRRISTGLRPLIKKHSLKTRKFIGNTSMDPQLALLMVNQAKVANGSCVLDPFVGSGSLLVAAAEFGAFVFGTDIDYLMLHGRTRPSRISQKKRAADESVRANMVQYGLLGKYVDVFVNDFSMKFWRDDVRFDAIITDPPYGIREATEKVGTSKTNYTISEAHLPTHIPAKIEYGISNIYKDLLVFAAKHLEMNGRLVCWFPVFREDYDESGLPSHACLKLVANCEQTLSKVTSRRLLTFEKIEEPTEEQSSAEKVDITDFRKKYFVVREESRKERRVKEAKIREANRLEVMHRKKT